MHQLKVFKISNKIIPVAPKSWMSMVSHTDSLWNFKAHTVTPKVFEISRLAVTPKVFEISRLMQSHRRSLKFQGSCMQSCQRSLKFQGLCSHTEGHWNFKAHACMQSRQRALKFQGPCSHAKGLWNFKAHACSHAKGLWNFKAHACSHAKGLWNFKAHAATPKGFEISRLMQSHKRALKFRGYMQSHAQKGFEIF